MYTVYCTVIVSQSVTVLCNKRLLLYFDNIYTLYLLSRIFAEFFFFTAEFLYLRAFSTKQNISHIFNQPATIFEKFGLKVYVHYYLYV